MLFSIGSASRKSSSQSASSCFSNCLTPPGLEQPSSDEPDWSTPRGSFAVTNDHSLDHDHNRDHDDDHDRDRGEDRDADDEDTTGLLSPSTTNTDISELQAAAETIEALSRRNWRRVSDFTSALPLTEMNLSPTSTALDRHRVSRRSGITTHLGGQPRGVIQFLPSVRKSDILSRNVHQAYMVDKVRRQRLCSDGNLISMPQMADQLCLRVPPTAVGDSDVSDAQMRLGVLSSKNSSPNSCRSSTPRSGYNGRGSSRYVGAETSPRKSLSTTGAGRPPPDMLLTNADDDRFSTLDTLDSVNRSPAVESLRSPSAGIPDADRYPSSTADCTLSSSSELSDITDYSYSSPPSEGILSDSDSSFLQADLLLWRRRSKGSIRKHQDTRTHIVKELLETETSYVENLKLLVHKYLRPLKKTRIVQFGRIGNVE
ncbi:Rho guanine nucleotide exchange factor [Trichinella spiralis]|uniref:Rho guanine nucleotide exchange factor n=1 Tax=Trichinella spiralis TaxID=6334 RepID=A0ABR3KW76_TRISP